MAHTAGEVHDLFGGGSLDRAGSGGRSGSGGGRNGSYGWGGGTGEVGVVVREEVVDSAALGAAQGRGVDADRAERKTFSAHQALVGYCVYFPLVMPP